MDPSREISLAVARFVERMSTLARELAYRQLVDTLDAGAPPARAARPTTSRSAGTARSVARVTAGAPRGPRTVGGRRSPDELERLRARLLEHIRASPGQRIEQIKVELGATTPELAVPLQKLLYADLVRTEGERRATRYFPAGPATPAGEPAA